ncbi:hypothetical protein NM688_g8083 [Phlebia brevispora]|uniref:Uncharacterized protein n=1 Tax=Phlebia brevispora TaxID=194682 RepID=A0ACC1RXG8_9APHY|nr:hypothetical protein NM688_g8083 [Phlebia brevispora]
MTRCWNSLRRSVADKETYERGHHAVAPATDASLEDAKKAGKFRPIGFKPIGSTEGKRKKKAKAKESKVGSKKKATEIKSDVGYDTSKTEIAGPSQQTEVTSTSKPAPPPPAEPEPEEEDIDIFAGVGEYTGIDLGDDDDEPSEGEVSDRPDEPSDVATAREEPLTRAPWFDTEDEHEPSRRPSTPPPASKSKSPSEPPLAPAEDLEEGEEQEAHAHLVPLASSAIPSIREFLAAEEEKEKREKRKAKRDKKKGKAVTGGDVSGECF